jgi:hypothetical protein
MTPTPFIAYRWSSYTARMGGEGSGWLDIDPMYLGLGAEDVIRRQRYHVKNKSVPFFGVAGNSIQTYRFADGSVFTHAGLMNIALQPLNYIGTAGNDIVTGSRINIVNVVANDNEWRIVA